MKGPIPVPNLEDLRTNPTAVNELPAEALRALMVEVDAEQRQHRTAIEQLDTVRDLALVRLALSSQAERQPEGDRLVTVEVAAEMLSKTCDDIYRHKYNFKVADGGRVKCSWQGLQEYIRHLTKRNTAR